jgi:ribosomal protein L40E
MEPLLGLFMPLLAAGGWLWWIYQSDRLEREPWPLVLKTLGLGAAAGLVSVLVAAIVQSQTGGLVTAVVETGLHLLGIAGAMYILPFRNPDWNEPFDGLVYGGAAGIGYGLIYTLPVLVADATLGFRVAIFSLPVFMLTGIILGHYMSQIKFNGQGRVLSLWLRALTVDALMLLGIDLALAVGGEVVSGDNMMAGLLAYGSNMLAWLIATQAMVIHNDASPFNPAVRRLRVGAKCRRCDAGYPVGAAYCNRCGQAVVLPQEAL